MSTKNIVSIFFIGIITFSITAYSVYTIATKDSEKEELVTGLNTLGLATIEGDTSNLVIDNDEKEYKTDFDTDLIFKYNYVDEGYNEIEEKPLNINMNGLTIEEIEKIYDDWEITSYNEKEIHLEKDIKTIDESKYLIGIDNGYVSVFENVDGELVLYMKTNKLASSLYDNDLLLLNEGIKVKNNSELLKVLADFES